MNARFLVLIGILVILSAMGIVALNQRHEGSAGLPETLSPHARRRDKAARPTGASPDAGPFRVAGLMLNGPTHTGGDPETSGLYGFERAFFGSQAATSLAIEHARAAGGLLGIDDGRSRVTRFEDDTGKSLLREKEAFGPFEMLPRVAEDGRHLVFVIPSDTLPDPAAQRIFASGVAALKVATKQADFVAADVLLQEESRFSVGGFEFEIERIGPSEWSDGQALTLVSKKDLAAISGYALVLADESEVELKPTMSMSGMGTWQQTLEFTSAPERASVRIRCWTDLATEEVPFAVEAGIGLR
jgi:hypothetical protein